MQGRSESFIENEAGCGCFQVLMAVFVYCFVKISSFFTIIFMSFGNYHPGWRCLDNTNISISNDTNLNVSMATQNTSVEYRRDLSCAAFDACRVVDVNPESSTIVTEWNLVCGRAWIASLIISLQMAGDFLGAFISGQIADTVGRKKTLYGSLLMNTILTCVSTLSPTWEVFAVFRFFIGVTTAFFVNLAYMYPAEFVTRKWRGPLGGVPSWAMGGILFGATSMALKNWRHFLLVSGGVSFLSFIPVVWVPESLRWLEVKNKNKEFKRVAEKIARCNKKSSDVINTMDLTHNEALQTNEFTKGTDAKKHTILDLFKPGYRFLTISVGVSWMSFNFILLAIGFGIKALSGDFYINQIIVYSILLPCAVLPIFAPNLLGRRLASCIFMSAVVVCLFSATVFELQATESLKSTATVVLVFCALVCVNTVLEIQIVHTSEIYPTEVRGLGMNWVSLMARSGGICAPFLIPSDSETVYIWYLVMGCLGFLCCVLMSRLPETTGKPLKETLDADRIIDDDLTSITEFTTTS